MPAQVVVMVVLQRTKRYTTTLFNLSTVKEKKESFFFSSLIAVGLARSLFSGHDPYDHTPNTPAVCDPYRTQACSIAFYFLFFFFVSLLRMSHALRFSSVFHVEAKKKKKAVKYESTASAKE